MWSWRAFLGRTVLAREKEHEIYYHSDRSNTFRQINRTDMYCKKHHEPASWLRGRVGSSETIPGSSDGCEQLWTKELFRWHRPALGKFCGGRRREVWAQSSCRHISITVDSFARSPTSSGSWHLSWFFGFLEGCHDPWTRHAFFLFRAMLPGASHVRLGSCHGAAEHASKGMCSLKLC